MMGLEEMSKKKNKSDIVQITAANPGWKAISYCREENGEFTIYQEDIVCWVLHKNGHITGSVYSYESNPESLITLDVHDYEYLGYLEPDGEFDEGFWMDEAKTSHAIEREIKLDSELHSQAEVKVKTYRLELSQMINSYINKGYVKGKIIEDLDLETLIEQNKPNDNNNSPTE
jgi:hypothetical protein